MHRLARLWYTNHWVTRLLSPLGVGYSCMMKVRHWCYRVGLKRTTTFAVPVVVVGNLTVGGTGKTPLVVSMAKALQQQGLRPGLVSRGYGGQAKQWPQAVESNSDPRSVGDEAVLLVQKTGCPMSVAADRVAAVRHLLARTECDVVISDDGLQHLRLGRTLEIVVVDGQRGFGNGRCLPAGPLREPLTRLCSVNALVTNGTLQATLAVGPASVFVMNAQAGKPLNLANPNQHAPLAPQRVHAVAGIGHPARFFKTLQGMGFTLIEHAFPDHHNYSPHDLAFDDSLPVVMTEKDAVKCRSFALSRWWYVPITAHCDTAFWSFVAHSCFGKNNCVSDSHQPRTDV